MIPRTLVPSDARPPAPGSAPEVPGRPTAMDERTLVPTGMPLLPLDGRSNIPASLPLGSISERTLVPRDINFERIPAPLSAANGGPPAYLPRTEMDARVAVPTGLVSVPVLQPVTHVPDELVHPDVFLTGEVYLLNRSRRERSALVEVLIRFSSGLLHALIILALLFGPQIFKRRDPTPTGTEIARQNLSYIFTPRGIPRSAPSRSPGSGAIRVDPRVLKRLAPSEPAPSPAPEKVVKELPDAPQPKEAPPETKAMVARPAPQLDAPTPREPLRGLTLPKLSAGRAIEESAKDVAHNSGRSAAISGPLPGGSGGHRGGPGEGTMGNGYEMLTPTEGVDFSNYMARVLASVRRNWYAVIPQSVYMGDKGRVLLRFRITREGIVPVGEPVLEGTSGKEPLDRAALSSIRTSNPFEPLPPAFSGPYIELRFIFLYNLPLESAQ
ncbi:MAG: energy transducer TonB [Acidobacteriia bacterium]|nr:energy transducer TonB [Terriglobia bacterium]